MSVYDEQLVTEALYGESAVKELIKESVIECEEYVIKLMDLMEEFNFKDVRKEAEKFIYQLLRLCGRRVTIQQLLSSLADKDIESVSLWTDVLEKCAVTQLYVISPTLYKQDTWVTPYLLLEDEEIQHINETEYLPPMLCVPDTWSTNTDGGWLSHKGSCILGSSLNHHNKKVSLDVLNLLQRVPWVVDDVMIKHEEIPNNELDTADKIRQFKMMAKASRRVYKYLGKRTFYFTWKFDKRGRMYSQGYQLHLQSTEYKKSILNFDDYHVCTGEL